MKDPRSLCIVCGERPNAVDENGHADICPAFGPLCNVCHAARRCAFACPCMTTGEALAIVETKSTVEATRLALKRIAELQSEGKTMGKAKMTSKTKSKTNGAAAKSSLGDDNKPVERARYDDMLPCKLEPSDIPARAAELAKTIREREEMLELKREANAKYRERIAYFDERLTSLAEAVEGKTEKRSVPCIEYLLPRTNEIQVVRQDTHEVVERRAAEPQDLQEGLFDGKGRDKDSDGDDATV